MKKKRILDKKKKNEQKWEITKNGKGNGKKIEKGKWQREKNRESRHPINETTVNSFTINSLYKYHSPLMEKNSI